MRSIRGLLFPQEGIFFELLESESKNVLKGAQLLSQMATKFDNNTNLIRKKIKNLEREGDKIVAEIHQRLNSSFITPIDHEDIANLANTYDDVIDGIYTFVNRLHIYNIKKIDSTTNTVTIQADGIELIDDENTKVLNFQFESGTIQSDGTKWYRL